MEDWYRTCMKLVQQCAVGRTEDLKVEVGLLQGLALSPVVCFGDGQINR